jgi:hypothetical protein
LHARFSFHVSVVDEDDNSLQARFSFHVSRIALGWYFSSSQNERGSISQTCPYLINNWMWTNYFKINKITTAMNLFVKWFCLKNAPHHIII